MHPINARVRIVAGVFALASLVVVLGASAASAAPSRSGFGGGTS
jgi:hypothetical protein